MTIQIVKTPDICSGNARLNGHRITVRHIVWHINSLGRSKKQVAKDLSITLEEVEAALGYYRTHTEEIEEEEQKEIKLEEELQKQYPSAFKERIKRLRAETA